MNTEHIEKFVNAIACDLEEGGFRQVSGTTLRRSLTEAVTAALPLLADTGTPASQPAELAEQQGDVRAQFEAWAKSYGHDLTRRPIGREGDDSYSDDFALYAWTAWQAALAATGKQQVGEESAGLPETCRSSTNAQGMQVGEVPGDALPAHTVYAIATSWREQASRLRVGRATLIRCAAELETALASRQPEVQS